MRIGILKENNGRVIITPDTARSLVASGHDVFCVDSAGLKAGFDNDKYIKSGAKLVKDNFELIKIAQLITSFKMPDSEILQKSSKNNIFINYSDIVNHKNSSVIISSNGGSLIGMEYIRDNSKNEMAIKLAELETRVAFNNISYHYNKPMDFGGKIIGNIPFLEQTKILIIGCGIFGEKIANMFNNKKCQINIFEKNYQRLSELDYLNASLHGMNSEILENKLQESDIVISCVSNDKKPVKNFIKKESIKKMKEGAMIFDFTINYGGTFETSKATTNLTPLYQKENIIHSCPTDLLYTMSNPASTLISNCALKYILLIAEGYSDNEVFRNAKLITNGKIDTDIVFLESDDNDILILKNPFELMEKKNSKSWKYSNDVNDFNDLLDDIEDYQHDM